MGRAVPRREGEGNLQHVWAVRPPAWRQVGGALEVGCPAALVGCKGESKGGGSLGERALFLCRAHLRCRRVGRAGAGRKAAKQQHAGAAVVSKRTHLHASRTQLKAGLQRHCAAALEVHPAHRQQRGRLAGQRCWKGACRATGTKRASPGAQHRRAANKLIRQHTVLDASSCQLPVGSPLSLACLAAAP